MYRKPIYYILILLSFYSFDTISERATYEESTVDSLSLDIQNRVLVTITESKNVISLDVSQGVKAVKLISASPLDGLDFRKYPSVIIKIELDGFEKVNMKLMDFVKGKNKKKKIAYFTNDEFSFSNFSNLKITIEDTSLDLKRFKVDLWIYLR